MFLQKQNGIVWISKETLAAMFSFCKQSLPNETGGVIIGYWEKQYEEAVVIQITGPGLKANHQLHSFIPDNKYQEAEIAKYYQNSGRLHTYMGDWLTHPYGNVSLSNTDRRTLRRIAKYKDARLPIPLMAIIGGSSNSILKVWCYQPTCFGNFGIRIKTKELKIKFY